MTPQPTPPPWGTSTLPPPTPSTTWPDDVESWGPLSGARCRVADAHPSCLPGQIADWWAAFGDITSSWFGRSPWVVLAVWAGACVWSVLWAQKVRQDVKEARELERRRARSEIDYAGEQGKIDRARWAAPTWRVAAVIPHVLVVVWLVGSGVGFGWLAAGVGSVVWVRRRWARVARG
jgi:hypothetical protein